MGKALQTYIKQLVRWQSQDFKYGCFWQFPWHLNEELKISSNGTITFIKTVKMFDNLIWNHQSHSPITKCVFQMLSERIHMASILKNENNSSEYQALLTDNLFYTANWEEMSFQCKLCHCVIQMCTTIKNI